MIQKWYKNLDGSLQQTNRLKMICPTCVKPLMALFNKYIPFSLERRICTIVENENVKEKNFKEMKKTLPGQKYPMLLIKNFLGF